MKTVLITGAARRIGKAIALGLARDGWRVVLHYGTSEEAAENLAGTIREQGGEAVAIQADLNNEQQVLDLIPKSVEQTGPLTCLINNASIFEEDSVDTASRQSWDDHMQVNLRTPFVLVQSFREQLPAELEGNVVNIIDQRVWNLTPHFLSYTLSKASLWTLTQTLAMSLAPHIRVNAIGPGPVLPSSRQSEKAFIKQWSSLPMRRKITLEEIVDAVRFILEAPSMTGQMIALDSGQHLGWSQEPPGGGTRE
ncbi:MAG: SDR family oxidoreductase [Rhodospirillaceae bacterium]|nr:SDR family oxidoreductase [Rhodospirillaceae bacterium]MBL6930087.1 SDR family oxidoreductase [Rhodospirillales bacterium]MBL6940631.1 SDR family oxidoreductase [Rhodospirillales bacterium]